VTFQTAPAAVDPHAPQPTLGAEVAADFPLLRRELDGLPIVYLDNAATTLKPQSVIDAVVSYYTHVGANIHRGKHRLSEEASADYENARVRVAEFIGAATTETVFVRSTTDGLNLVCQGLALAPDDLALVQLDAHHSNMLPWRRTCHVEYIPLDERGLPRMEEYVRLLERRPRVVALSHCSNVTGVVTPIETMGALAREAGAIIVVDGAQSVPHRRVVVRDLPIDFLAFSGHKMLGPTGIGVLYGRAEMLERLSPPAVGGGAVDWVDLDRYDFRRLPHRFEAGTPHIAGAYGLGAAIEYLERIGMDRVTQHVASVADVMLAELGRRPYLQPLFPEGAQDRTSIVSFAIDGIQRLDEVARSLSDAYGLMCRSGHLCAQPLVDAYGHRQVLRASGYVYNTEADIRLLFAALDEIVG